eukprot:g6075.t1
MALTLLVSLCTHPGDLSKVQWPAAIQHLNLQECRKIEGLQMLNLSYCEKVEGDLSKVQWPDGLQKLQLDNTNVSGDLSKVQWPAGLQDLDLSRTKVSASLQQLSLSGCREVTGDLSKVQWPASLQDLNLFDCNQIIAPAGCPKDSDGDLYYDSKEACDELREWIASQ